MIIASATTPAAITAFVWAVSHPTPAVAAVAAALDSIAILAWILYRVGQAETRMIDRIGQVEQAHSARIFDEAADTR